MISCSMIHVRTKQKRSASFDRQCWCSNLKRIVCIERASSESRAVSLIGAGCIILELYELPTFSGNVNAARRCRQRSAAKSYFFPAESRPLAVNFTTKLAFAHFKNIDSSTAAAKNRPSNRRVPRLARCGFRIQISRQSN